MEGERRRGGVGRFLGTFANAVLERTLPRIREWLEARLGPRATIRKLELDGPRVHLIDATIPLGARLVVSIDRATLLANPEDFARNLAEGGHAPVRLERLDGRITAHEGDEVVFSLPLRLIGRTASSDAWIDAELVVHDAEWRVEHGVGEAATLEGTARVRVTTDAWTIEDGRLTSGLSQVFLSAAGSTRDGDGLTRASLTAEAARAGHFLDALSAWTGRVLRLEAPLPWHARLDGSAELARGAVTADLSLSTDASALRLVVDADPGGAIRVAELTGSVAWEDLAQGRALPGLDAARSAPVVLDARASGDLDAPDLSVRLECPSVVAAWLARPTPCVATVSRSIDGTLAAQAQLAGVGDLAMTVGRGLADRDALEGTGEVTLRPEGLRVRGAVPSGDPLVLSLVVEGARATPRWSARGGAEALCLSPVSAPPMDASASGDASGARPLSLRRLRVEASGAASLAALELRGTTSARCGAGALRVEHGPDGSTLRAERLGADATIAILALLSGDGASRRLPLPEDAQLWAELARVDGVTLGHVHVETARSRLSFSPLRYAAAEGFDGSEVTGSIAVSDAVALGVGPLGRSSEPDERVDGTARLSGGGERAVVLDGALTSDSLTVPIATERVKLTELRATGRLSRDILSLSEVSACALGGRVEAALSVRGAVGGRRRVVVDRLAVRSATDVGALLARFTPPGSAAPSVTLDAELSGDGARLSGPIGVSIATDAWSAEVSVGLSLDLGVDGGALAGSTVRGAFSTRPVSSDEGVRLGQLALEGRADCDGALLGTLSRPELRLDLTSERLCLARTVGAVSEETQPLLLMSVRSHVSLTSSRLSWAHAEAAVHGGTLRSSGVVGFGSGFVGVAARVTGTDVALQGLSPFDGLLRGRASLSTAIWGSPSRWSARGKLTVDEPIYDAMRHALETFSRYGLLPLPSEGHGPLTAELILAQGELTVRDISLAVPGARASGAVLRGADGTFRGDVVVVAEEAWLRTSHLLEGPARWFGDVHVPLRVEGHGRPRLRPDALAVIDGLIAKSVLGRGLRAAFDRLSGDAAEVPRRASTASLLSTDALVERVAARAADSADAIGALLDRGLTPLSIADRADARRRRS